MPCTFVGDNSSKSTSSILNNYHYKIPCARDASCEHKGTYVTNNLGMRGLVNSIYMKTIISTDHLCIHTSWSTSFD